VAWLLASAIGLAGAKWLRLALAGGLASARLLRLGYWLLSGFAWLWLVAWFQLGCFGSACFWF